VTRGSEFGVFKSAPTVRYIRRAKVFSRAELARLEELAKEWGAKRARVHRCRRER